MSSVAGSGPNRIELAQISLVVVGVSDNSSRLNRRGYIRIEPSGQSRCDKKNVLRWYMRVVYIGMFVGLLLAAAGISTSNPPDWNWLFYSGVVTLGSSSLAAVPAAVCQDHPDVH